MTSYSLVQLHHVGKALKSTLCPKILCRFECNRTISSVSQRQVTPPNLPNVEQLARSRPRLMKEYESEKKRDGMSHDWDLIFTTKRYNTILSVAQWASTLSLLALPIYAFLNFWEYDHEDNVIFASITIKKKTEFFLFLTLNAFIMAIMLKNVRTIPKRIYFHDKNEEYVAMCRGWCPWLTVRKQFQPSEIRHLPYRGLPIDFRFLRNNDYIVSGRRLVFPYMCFRSGQDRYWLLRYVEH